VGGDHRITPAILIGGLVQFDWMNEPSSSSLDASANGHGWMAGPYISLRPTRDLYVDARAAWGASANQVNPLGIYSDDFSTGRGLVSAKVTGRWSHGAFHSRPNAEIIYFRDTQSDYSNRLHIDIPEQSVSLGRLAFGPEIGRAIALGNRLALEPFLGINGLWDFASTADMTLAGVTAQNDRFRGRIELGATAKNPSGIAFSASLSRDGIGNRAFHATRAHVWIVVPIN
jgi:outer membrane autotransporter protein